MALAALAATPACSDACDETCLAGRYDAAHPQAEVTTRAELDAALAALPTVRYRDLPGAYVHRTGQDRAPFARRLRRKRYLRVEGEVRHRFLVGTARLSDFMSPTSDGDGISEYLLLDPRLPRRLLALRRWLERNGYDPNGYSVREGFRPPQINIDEGGARLSRHIYGEAADLVRGDLDRDGDADADDKAILLRAAEAVIGNRGGVGRYPGSETVHIDVRGRRARWDSY